MKIHNPYDHLIAVELQNVDGTKDGVHVQPHTTVTLPSNFSPTANSRAQYPRMRLSDMPAVGVALPPQQQEVEAAPAPKSDSKKGA